MCFRDMSYCSARCATLVCSRNQRRLDPGGADHEAYTRWSKGFPDDSGPVALMDLSVGCNAYRALDE